MKKYHFFVVVWMLISKVALSQNYSQYFDGKDTLCNPNVYTSAICIDLDNKSNNIWQIGVPKKTIFNAAATHPKAILTDTMHYYPPNNVSSFQFTIYPRLNSGIMAIQWKQKLEMDMGLDGGKIEFTNDGGGTWQNAFNNPYVYNFYGFEPTNIDTLANGDFVFSGTDTLWRDIWLCYDYSWIWGDSLIVRFTFSSDSLDNKKEGWMIDNMLVHLTAIHTVSEVKQEKYLNVFPNPTSDIIHIETQKIQDFHIIEKMELLNSIGQKVEEWRNIPTKFFFHTQKYNEGVYFLKVKTNKNSETVPIIIHHD